jgi:hypothetical protein
VTDVYFNGIYVEEFYYEEPGNIRAVVPERATSGRIEVVQVLDESHKLVFKSKSNFIVLPPG